MQNTLKRSLTFLGIALIFIVFLGCSEQAETGVETETQVSKVKSVKVSQAEALPPRGSLEYVGVLSAFRKVNVAGETGGTIEKLYFEKGDRVKKVSSLPKSAQAVFGSMSTRRRLQFRPPKATWKR